MPGFFNRVSILEERLNECMWISAFLPKFTLDLIGNGNDIFMRHVYLK